MKISETRVNVLECDIEDFLWEHPGEVQFVQDGVRHMVTAWIGRQYKVYTGVIDLLGWTDTGNLAVVEVKNVPISASAITQVLRYWNMLSMARKHNGAKVDIFPVLVGPSIGDDKFTEAFSCGVSYIEFSVDLSLRTRSFVYAKGALENISDDAARIAVDLFGEPTSTEDEQDIEAAIESVVEKSDKKAMAEAEAGKADSGQN